MAVNVADRPVSVSEELDALSVPSSSFSLRGSSPATPGSFQDIDSDNEHASSRDHDGLPSYTATARALLDQLVTFQGCSDTEHRAAALAHDGRGIATHYNLAQTSHPLIPLVLDQDGMLGNKSGAKVKLPPRATLRLVFEGGSAQRWSPRHICLHKEVTKKARAPDIAYDFDSFLGFPSSLAFARRGLKWLPTPPMVLNIKTNVHLKVPVEQAAEEGEDPRATTAQIKDTPHCLLGYLEGAEYASVYVIFPKLYRAGTAFHALTEAQLRRWTDGVMNPALHTAYPAHQTQYFRPSSQAATDAARAKQAEQRTGNAGPRQPAQNLTYDLTPDGLHRLWDLITRQVQQPGYHDFRDVFLFVSAKGLKGKYKHRRTLGDCIGTFVENMEYVMDQDFIHPTQFYVDLGKESCPPDGQCAHRALGPEQEAQTYLYRTCCVKSLSRKLHNQAGKRNQLYQVAFLGDSSNLTAESGPNSDHRRTGWVYSQYYHCAKSVLDAAKTYPFTNDGLETIGLNPNIFAGANTEAKAAARSFAVIQQSYHRSKTRLSRSIRDSTNKSFGVREEHRLSWILLLELWTQVQERDEVPHELPASPPYVWTIQTKHFMRYLYDTANKWAAGYEMTLASAGKSDLSWEQSKVAIMFLRGLRFCTPASNLAMESPLWRGATSYERDGEVAVKYGLDFGFTLPTYGHAWLRRMVDWDTFTFRKPYRSGVYFGNRTLTRHYIARQQDVHAFANNYRILETCREWFDRYPSVTAQLRIIVFMIHVCLRQFRLDVLGKIRKDCLPQYHGDLLTDRVVFCVEDFARVLGTEPHLVTGNRSMVTNFDDLFELFFGVDPTYHRTYWKTLGFRQLYQLATKILGTSCTLKGKEETWVTRFRRALSAHHAIFPVHNQAGGGLLKREKRVLQFWSLIHEPGEGPVWGKEERRGMLNMTKLPFWLDWPLDRWEDGLKTVARFTSEQ